MKNKYIMTNFFYINNIDDMSIWSVITNYFWRNLLSITINNNNVGRNEMKIKRMQI